MGRRARNGVGDDPSSYQRRLKFAVILILSSVSSTQIQASDTPLPNIEKRLQTTLSHLTKDFELPTVRRGILILGGPSDGKTTLALLLAKYPDLLSENSEKGIVISTKDGSRIGKRTIYPTLLDGKYVDFPRFGDGEDVSEELAARFVANQAYPSLLSFKIILCSRRCVACDSAQRLYKLIDDFKRFTTFLQDIEWFEESLLFVMTNSKKDDFSSSSDYDKFKDEAEQALFSTRAYLQREIKDGKIPAEEIPFIQNVINLLLVFGKNTNVAVSLAPAKVRSEGLFDDYNIRTTVNEIGKALKPIAPTAFPGKMTHPLSIPAVTEAELFKNFSISSAENVTKMIFASITEQKDLCMNKGDKGIYALNQYYSVLEESLTSWLSGAEYGKEDLVLMKQLNALLIPFGIKIPQSLISALNKYNGYSAFCNAVLGEKETSHFNLIESLGFSLHEDVKIISNWTNYVTSLNDYLSSDDFQQDRYKYNVSDIKNEWGNGNESTNAGIKVTRENFHDFYEKVKEMNSTFKNFDFLMELNPESEQIETVNNIVNNTINDPEIRFCKGRSLFILRNFLTDSGFRHFLNETLPYLCDSEEILLTAVHYIGLNVIYPKSKESNLGISLIAPIISTPSNIDLRIFHNGWGAGDPFNITYIQGTIEDYDQTASLIPQDGNAGTTAKNPLGHVLVATTQSNGLGEIQIDAHGSRGGDGSPAWQTNEVYKTSLPYDKIWEELCHKKVGRGLIQSGSSGHGNFPPITLFLRPDSRPIRISTNQFYGKRGSISIGSIRAVVGLANDGGYVTCSNEARPGPGFSENGIQPDPKQDRVNGSSFLLILNEYRKFAIARVNTANVETISTFLDFLYIDDFQVKKLMDTKIFAEEVLSLVEAWHPEKTSRLATSVISSQLNILDERAANFLKSPIPSAPVIICSYAMIYIPGESEVCKHCNQVRCWTILHPGSSESGLEYIKALFSIRSGIASTLAAIERNRDHYLVINIETFFTVIEAKVKRYKDTKDEADEQQRKQEASEAMQQINKDYLQSIDKKIEGMESMIKTHLVPELEKVVMSLNDVITELSAKLKEKIDDKFADGQAINDETEKLEKSVKTKSFFGRLGYAFTALASTGEPVSSTIGNVGGKLNEDVQKLAFGKERTPEEWKQYTEESKANTEKIKNFLKYSQKFYNDNLLVGYNDLTEFFDMALKKSNHPDLKNAYDVFQHQYARLKNITQGDYSLLIESFDEMLSIKRTIYLKVKGLTQNVLRKVFDGNPFVDDIITAWNFVDGIYDGIENILTDLFAPGAREKLKLAQEAAKAVAEELGALKQMQTYLDTVISGQAKMVQTVATDFANGKLESATLSKIDAEAYKSQQIVRDLRDHIAEFSTTLQLGTQIDHVARKMDETLGAISKSYERIATYREHQDFASYIYAINAVAYDVKIPTELETTVAALEKAVEKNMILWFYNKAISAFLQYVFPLAHRYKRFIKIDITKENIDDFIDLVLTQLQNIREELAFEKSVVIGGPDEHRHYRRFYPSNIARPFFTWSSDSFQSDINTLFEGLPVAFSASILETPIDLDAVKFNAIDLVFIVRETEADHEALNKELAEILTYYSIEMMHTGDNYYRFENKYFSINTDSILLKFTFEVDDKGERTDKNAAYQKVEAGDIVLSPYTLWELKLVLGPIGKEKGINLEKFYEKTVDMMLCGRGTYFSSDIYKEGIPFETEVYYKVDEQLGNISSNSLQNIESFGNLRNFNFEMVGDEYTVSRKPLINLNSYMKATSRAMALARKKARLAAVSETGIGYFPNENQNFANTGPIPPSRQYFAPGESGNNEPGRHEGLFPANRIWNAGWVPPNQTPQNYPIRTGNSGQPIESEMGRGNAMRNQTGETFTNNRNWNGWVPVNRNLQNVPAQTGVNPLQPRNGKIVQNQAGRNGPNNGGWNGWVPTNKNTQNVPIQPGLNPLQKPEDNRGNVIQNQAGRNGPNNGGWNGWVPPNKYSPNLPNGQSAANPLPRPGVVEGNSMQYPAGRTGDINNGGNLARQRVNEMPPRLEGSPKKDGFGYN